MHREHLLDDPAGRQLGDCRRMEGVTWPRLFPSRQNPSRSCACSQTLGALPGEEGWVDRHLLLQSSETQELPGKGGHPEGKAPWETTC